MIQLKAIMLQPVPKKWLSDQRQQATRGAAAIGSIR